MAGGDDRAVRQPRHDRGHLARGDRDHGLVEEADPGPLLPELDEAFADGDHGEVLQVGVRVPGSDGQCLLGDRPGEDEIAGGIAPQPLQCQQVPLLDAGRPGGVEEPLSPGHPAGGPRLLTAQHEIEAQPERAPDGPRDLARAQPGVVRPRPGVGALTVPAGHVRGESEPFEALGVERAVQVCPDRAAYSSPHARRGCA
uniref:hypothetical protein n=1 Tax=Streptomyces sp. NBC_01001 TaxID=2903713 RepID=UPI003BAC508C